MSLLFRKACKKFTGEIKAAHQIPLQFARSAAGSGGRVSGIFSEQIEVVDHFVPFSTALEDSTTVRHTDVHYNYITTLCCIWHGICIPLQHRTLHCSTLHSTTLRCTTLQLLCCVTLRYVMLWCVMFVRMLHSLTLHGLHYIAMHDRTQFITLH